MALVESMVERPGERQKVHEPAECAWQVFESNRGRILQLDSFGSRGRKIVGKKSQTLQFDERSARQLAAVLRRAFPGA
jgi:hypothetical protein